MAVSDKLVRASCIHTWDIGVRHRVSLALSILGGDPDTDRGSELATAMTPTPTAITRFDVHIEGGASPGCPSEIDTSS